MSRLYLGGVAERCAHWFVLETCQVKMGSRRSSGIAELSDLARTTDGLSIFAASKNALSKSAVGFDSATRETWKDLTKHAWAPSSQRNLSSSSSRFRSQVEPNSRSYAVAVGVVPSIESLKQFGRVSENLLRLILLSTDLVQVQLQVHTLSHGHRRY